MLYWQVLAIINTSLSMGDILNLINKTLNFPPKYSDIYTKPLD